MLLPLLLAVTARSDDLLRQVDPALLRATVQHLAAYPNRNTNNPGLTQAAEWLAGEFRKIPGLQVEIMHYTAPKSGRVPVEKDVVEVVATLPGRTSRRVMVGGHFDTINLAVPGLEGRAPGANDDSSGTALTLEMARVLSTRKWNNTVVFACFSGEEQALLGSAALARRAKTENWPLEAVLSNDIVGCSESLNGQKDKRHVRVFSEQSTDHNGRELARYVEWISRGQVRGFSPILVLRKDRFQRGGDHTSFNNEGFTAVRFTEGVEEFTRQHNDQDLPQYVDFRYLANVARINLLTLASLANAGEAPSNVRYARPQAHDTTITWKATPGVSYRVYWRKSANSLWEGGREVGMVDKATIAKINKDDHEFAVGAVGGIPIAAQ